MADRSHRWSRARVGDPEYGRVCGCGALKDEQALSCRRCYADRRRQDDLRTCPTCSGPKSRSGVRCKDCADDRKRGVPITSGRAQPQSHPWRAKVAA